MTAQAVEPVTAQERAAELCERWAREAREDAVGALRDYAYAALDVLSGLAEVLDGVGHSCFADALFVFDKIEKADDPGATQVRAALELAQELFEQANIAADLANQDQSDAIRHADQTLSLDD